MPLTPNGLPYPPASVTPNVPYDLQRLADAIDPYVGVIPGAALRADEAQTIPNGTITALVFDVVEQLRGGMTLGPNGGVIVPREGWYGVDVGMRWQSSASGSRQVRIINGGVQAAADVRIPNATGGYSHDLSRAVYCAAGDEVWASVYQSSGGDLGSSPNFGMPYLVVTWKGE